MKTCKENKETCETNKVIKDMFWCIMDSITDEIRLAKMQGKDSICITPYEESPYMYEINGDLFKNFAKSRWELTREESDELADIVMDIVHREIEDIIKSK